jgi:Zn-dependent membrane protease YugP
MWWGFFDPMYLVFVAPAILLALWAQFRVKSAYAEASRIPSESGLSGAEAADAVLRRAGVGGVEIEPVEGFLSDHYVPGKHVLRLSPQVYAGRSLAAVGVAAHEAGHAIQDARRYPLLVARSALVPAASFGSSAAWIILLIGFALHQMLWIKIGIFAFAAVVLFQLVNLPVEFDASRRARLALVDGGLVSPEEGAVVKRVLDAAALTYVAATLSAVMTLLYFLFRAGLLGGRSSD